MQPDEPDRFPCRKSPRLEDYDYSSPNYYFITICTHEKQCIFGTPEKLNRSGQIAKAGLDQIPLHFSGVEVDKYVVMPNHIHAIIVLNKHNVDLSVVIGQYKAYVTKSIRMFFPKAKVWQTSFHDHVIRNQQDYQEIWKYIDEKPLKWGADCFYVGV